MKSNIQQRPKNMEDLKDTKAYKEWIKSIPDYIP